MTDETQVTPVEAPAIEAGIIPFTQWGSVSAELLGDMAAANAVAAALDAKAQAEQAKATEEAIPEESKTWVERLAQIEEARKPREEATQQAA